MTQGKVDGGAGNVATASSYVAVTPHDSNLMASRCRALWIGGAGNLTVKCPDTGANVLFSGVAAGTQLNIQVDVVLATGTTATGIVALF